MKYFVFLLFISQAHAALKVKGDDVLPFTNKTYEIRTMIKDYAELMNLTVTYPSDMISVKESIHVEMNTKSSKSEFKKLFYGALASAGYTAIQDESILWLFHGRDIRYLTTRLYTDESYPKDASFSTVMYKLKYPLSAEVARNMRPFMSRYGRIIDLPDAKTIILNDRGDNSERLIRMIKIMDVEKAYKEVAKLERRNKADKDNPLNEKVMELELQNKMLEKKLIEIKYNQSGGMQ